MVVDVTDERSVRAMFDEIGELNHLFVTASPSPGPRGNFLDQDVAAAQAYMNGKFFETWACARYPSHASRRFDHVPYWRLLGSSSLRLFESGK